MGIPAAAGVGMRETWVSLGSYAVLDDLHFDSLKSGSDPMCVVKRDSFSGWKKSVSYRICLINPRIYQEVFKCVRVCTRVFVGPY